MASTRKHRKNRRVTGTAAVDRTDVGCQSNSCVSCDEGDLIDQTVDIWQKRAKRQLTREDGREIIQNMSGFFRVLREWDRIDRASKMARKRSAD